MNDINLSDLNLRNMIDLRYDEIRGIIKIYNVRGKIVITNNDVITKII